MAKAEDVAFGSLDKINNYYGNRTRVIAKISKVRGRGGHGQTNSQRRAEEAAPDQSDAHVFCFCLCRFCYVIPLCQYPAILDYWQGVKELDEVFYT